MQKVKYIVFEGSVGAGKSTMTKMLSDYIVNEHSINVVTTREPGGSEISEAIRTLVQGTKFNTEMYPITDAYLYAAARSESLRRIVKPALEKGYYVISDRSFVTSLAYQSLQTGGLTIEEVWNINKPAVRDILPDLIIHLGGDLPNQYARTFDPHGDKWEQKPIEFFEQVESQFEKASQLDLLKERWINIIIEPTIEETFEIVKKEVSKILFDY